MKLARKFVAAITLVVILVLGVSHLFSVSREESFYDAHVNDYHVALGRAVGALVDCMARDGTPASATRCMSNLGTPTGARAPQLHLREVEDAGDSCNVTRPTADGYVTRVSSGGGRRVVEVSEPFSRHDELRRGLWVEWSMTAAALVAVAAIVMLSLGARLIGRPMERLVQQARRVGTGDFTIAAPAPQNDEIGTLSEEMNQMCAQIRESDARARDEAARRGLAIEQLRRADRLGTAGQLAAGVAHELGTPLNIAQGRAQLIAEDGTATAAVARNARIIVDQIVRMSGIIRQLLGFTRRGRPDVAVCDLREIARSAAELLRSMAKKESVALEVDLAVEPVHVRADVGLLGQVAVNLIVNAIQARRSERGVVRIAASRGTASGGDSNAPAGDAAVLSISDDGTGISPDDLPHLFEPFFTTKEVGRGTGLGLWVSYGIVKEYGGSITVESHLGSGASFSVILPVANPSLGEERG